MINANVWDRQLWGVQLIGADGRSRLIGSAWSERTSDSCYPGEPSRALLFQTRDHARDWCAQKHRLYRTRPEWDSCRKWRLRPVRVRERVTVERP
jgi:hypothetical protein